MDAEGRGGRDVAGVAGRGPRQHVARLAAVVLDLEHAELLAREVRADLAQVGHDDEAVRDRQQNHVGRLQQARDAQPGEAIERLFVVDLDVMGVQFLKLYQVRVEMVQDGTEGQAVPPGGAEVGDLYSLVTLRDLLAPLQQRLTGTD